MDISLKGKNAIVCGSTQGIGLASAIALSKLGASVTLLARDEGKLRDALKMLEKSETNHGFLVADFSKTESLKLALKSLKGPVHILVNNTGGPPSGAIVKAKEDEFLHAFNNHMICNHILAQAVIPYMKEAGYGRIINIISTSVKAPLRNLGVSNTVRAAVANWSKTLAGEVAEFNITVNNVLPGATNTQRLQSIISNKAAATGIKEEDVMKEMKEEVPMRRFAEPEEVASAVAFLASPSASYITGINLPVDGDRTSCL